MAARFPPPRTIRSRLILEVASELAGAELADWPFPQVQVRFRDQGDAAWGAVAMAGDAPRAIDEVARGEALISIVNPSSILAQAYLGRGGFATPVPVRTIAVLPSEDCLALAVTDRTGLRSLDDLRERRFPLRVSLRGQRDHSVHAMLREVLDVAGIRLEDIVAWGGEVHYDRGLPSEGRLQAVERGTIDAIFDEAVPSGWVDRGLATGMRVLTLTEAEIDELGRRGLRRNVLRRSEHPGLPADLPSIDFSGWPVFTLADAPERMVRAFCAALEARRDRIPWQGQGPLPLEDMVRDTPAAPLTVPLHPAAEAYWRERGILP